MEPVSAEDAASRFEELIEHVETTGESFTITRDGVPVAVVVPARVWSALRQAVSGRS